MELGNRLPSRLQSMLAFATGMPDGFDDEAQVFKSSLEEEVEVYIPYGGHYLCWGDYQPDEGGQLVFDGRRHTIRLSRTRYQCSTVLGTIVAEVVAFECFSLWE